LLTTVLKTSHKDRLVWTLNIQGVKANKLNDDRASFSWCCV